MQRQTRSWQKICCRNIKIATELGWEPAYTFEQGMKKTIQWYLEKSIEIENIISGDYASYYNTMYFKSNTATII